MAGSQDPGDNPVAVNVVPMVDVIFCLCVFFMCSLQFREQEGKFRTWLPKDKGGSIFTEMPVEIRFALLWDEAHAATVVQFGVPARTVRDASEVQQLIRASVADYERVHRPRVPVIVDADPRVPWEQVATIVNLAKREGVRDIEFAAGRRR